jgi:hypothetical protein
MLMCGGEKKEIEEGEQGDEGKIDFYAEQPVRHLFG